MNENWSKKERSGGDESEERKSFVRSFVRSFDERGGREKERRAKTSKEHRMKFKRKGI